MVSLSPDVVTLLLTGLLYVASAVLAGMALLLLGKTIRARRRLPRVRLAWVAPSFAAAVVAPMATLVLAGLMGWWGSISAWVALLLAVAAVSWAVAVQLRDQIYVTDAGFCFSLLSNQGLLWSRIADYAETAPGRYVFWTWGAAGRTRYDVWVPLRARTRLGQLLDQHLAPRFVVPTAPPRGKRALEG